MIRRMAVLLIVAAGIACVDRDKSAVTFCTRNQERLAQHIDVQGVPVTVPPEFTSDAERERLTDRLDKAEQSFNKTLRYAEDATKAIRNGARDVDQGYLDVAKAVGDDKAEPSELEAARNDLQEALEKTRQACAEFSS